MDVRSTTAADVCLRKAQTTSAVLVLGPSPRPPRCERLRNRPCPVSVLGLLRAPLPLVRDQLLEGWCAMPIDPDVDIDVNADVNVDVDVDLDEEIS